MEPLLKAVNLSKNFGTLPVVQRVSLEVFPGEVVGLVGQSGSGKSTLVMLLAGFHTPDEGELYFCGNRLVWPFSVRALGIEVIHQSPSLAENLDITSNIFLGNEIGWPFLGRWFKIPSRSRMDQEAGRILMELEVNYTSLRQEVINLTSEKRQMIAIARTLTTRPTLVIIDDPLRLLSYPYQKKLISLIQMWQNQGTAVLFSSNNLDHLLAVTDRIIVLRQGRRVNEYITDGVDRDEILAAMVGTTDHNKLTPIIWALDSYYRAREQAESIQQSKGLLQNDLMANDTLRRQLIDQLAEQVSLLDSANLALQDAQRRLLTELEQERKHLAREIHDQVIQDLLSTNYQLEEIESDSEVTESLRGDLISVRQNIRELIVELRNICGQLRPPTIDSLGLGAALQSLTRDWMQRTTIPVGLNLDHNLGRLPEAIELSIFRIIQEGLNNIQKHAQANQVHIHLYHTTPRALMISIADNGRGLEDAADLSTLSSEGHFGLLGISERVALLGGRLRLQNQPGGGLLIQAEIPHPRVDFAAHPDS